MISRHNQPWQPTEHPILDWSDTGVPRSVEYDDVYYSSANGVAESRYVFLQGSQLDQHARHPPEEDACVVETGFGTGLNFLVTADHWLSEKQATSSFKRTSRLHYVGIDAKPLSASDVTRASAHWPDFKFPAKTLISEWPGSVRGCHRLQWHHLGITLDLWWESLPRTARESLASLWQVATGRVNARFLAPRVEDQGHVAEGGRWHREGPPRLAS